MSRTMDGQAAADWPGIQACASSFPQANIDVTPGGIERAISNQQIRWWKGILLHNLAKDGNSITYWESLLKLLSMPEKFAPVGVIAQGTALNVIPSVKILNTVETGQLMEGAVDKLRNPPFEKDWVTLPNKDYWMKDIQEAK